MSKEINIQADEAKRKLDEIARSSAEVGQKTQQAGRAGAEGIDQVSQKTTG